MTTRFQLEAFDPAPVSDDILRLSMTEFEDARLAAFEQGYSAGWEDAIAAQDREILKLRADLGRNLQQMAFTYHEARVHILRTLQPLLQQIVTKVLPVIAQGSLGPILLEQLEPLAAALAEAPVTVAVNPASRRTVEALLSERLSLPLVYAEDKTLSEGQAELRMGETEARIDIDGVIAAIAGAMAAYFQIESEVPPDGR